MSGHGPHADPHDPFQKRVAISMALYAVLLAFTTMLTSEARTESLLLATKAANVWSHFQSKSTKGVVVKEEVELLDALGVIGEGTKATIARDKLSSEVGRYDKEKEELQKEADSLDKEGEHEKHKMHFYEYAATIVELGIVIATVSLLLSSSAVFYGSAAVAVASACLTTFTYFFG